MAKSEVLCFRVTQREEWLLSWLEPEYPGQPLSQRLRNLLIDSAAADLKIDVDHTARGDRTIILPKGLKLKKGEEPVPRRWPVA